MHVRCNRIVLQYYIQPFFSSLLLLLFILVILMSCSLHFLCFISHDKYVKKRQNSSHKGKRKTCHPYADRISQKQLNKNVARERISQQDYFWFLPSSSFCSIFLFFFFIIVPVSEIKGPGFSYSFKYLCFSIFVFWYRFVCQKNEFLWTYITRRIVFNSWLQ